MSVLHETSRWSLMLRTQPPASSVHLQTTHHVAAKQQKFLQGGAEAELLSNCRTVRLQVCCKGALFLLCRRLHVGVRASTARLSLLLCTHRPLRGQEHWTGLKPLQACGVQTSTAYPETPPLSPCIKRTGLYRLSLSLVMVLWSPCGRGRL